MKNRSTGRLDGFTLIELLIVVLIIGVLTAVALPKYQGAVDKSRYSTLMPMAKNIATSQEAFYLASGDYSEDLSNLDTQIIKDTTGPTAELSDGTKLEISQRESHKYVKMSKDNLENNYIVYQNKSPNYAGEIHCEALKDSTRAERLCETLGGEKINGYLTPGYDTYVLEGTGLGMSADVADKIDQAGNGGWQTCDTYPCTKTCNRPIASGYSCEGTYQENGSYTERSCQGDVCVEKKFGEDGKMDSKRTCVMKGTVCYSQGETTYDEAGNKTSHRTNCLSYGSDGSCTSYRSGTDYTYDADGNKTSERYCGKYGADGSCTGYYRSGTDYTYDADGKMISERNCDNYGADGSCPSYDSGGTDYTYDANGNKTSMRYCDSYGSDGSCTSYRSGTEYTYDANGKMTSSRPCNNYGADGSCTSYSNNTVSRDYTYDANGKLTSERNCWKYGADGSCTSYISGTDYTYDANGNYTSTRFCSSVGSDGSCTSYSSGTEYTYDANGNRTSERSCSSYGADGSCTRYGWGIDHTYDANGNKTSTRHCSSVGSDGSCTSYSSGTEYTYDANGNNTSYRECGSYGSDGSCTHYGMGSADYTYDEDGNKTSIENCRIWSGTTCSEWRERGYYSD